VLEVAALALDLPTLDDHSQRSQAVQPGVGHAKDCSRAVVTNSGADATAGGWT